LENNQNSHAIRGGGREGEGGGLRTCPLLTLYHVHSYTQFIMARISSGRIGLAT
jgi:hypothetical protein